MKRLFEEFQRRHVDRKNNKTSSWTSLIIKIIILIFIIMLMKNLSHPKKEIFNVLFGGTKTSSNQAEK